MAVVAADRAASERRRGHRTHRPGPRMRRADHVAGWAFVSPAVLLIGLFGLVPVVWSLLLSFQQTDLTSPGTWTGASNYQKMVHDPVFWQAARQTLVYCVLFVPITMLLAIPIAVLLNQKVRGMLFYRMAVYVPLVTSTVATGVIFSWLLNPQFGLVNAALGKVGLPQQGFFQSTGEALPAVVMMTVWGWLGFAVIIYLSALQNVPRELMEAAALDGCGRVKAFWKVELPLLAPASSFLLVWLTINALQLFDEVYVTTKGGPLHASTVLVYYLYQQAFVNFDGGYAAAIGSALFLVILAVTMVQLWLSRRASHYEVN
ncbi:carbohydrate ABC transporter permease [Actinoallomurus rhizosphaericola]|uniref:carbohydrate ABC transporter permease n=1 Tax=Actinoallomurus rhizosphaericola TaxID=2952536 RepID=UPI00209232A9|nr:sugar ABC transporter permease [Actinoallomurus rhizosphaericola]MCO5998863.1 sugar ABC transporter permease [Actinoallomurus rhizosphaericola]